jgi:lipopolysaccharide export LptBFGC system permease protein LptF
MEFFALLLGLLMMVFIFIVSSILTLGHQWEYYTIEYNKLAHYSFRRFEDQVWANENNDFVYFFDDGTIRLTTNVYIYNAFFTYFDPYSFYWLIKFNRYMKKNVIPYLN